MIAISMAEAKSRFSELVSRTAAGERFLIRRRERTVAVLIGPDELERLERSAQAAQRLALALGQDEALLRQVEARQTHPIMAAYGLWGSDPSFDHLVEDLYQSRSSAPNRPEVDW